jgi:anti-sigma factor RsiW
MTMSPQTSQTRTNECTAPEVGKLLPAYIVDRLKDSECEKVEIHLAGCDCCKGHYLTMLEARQAVPVEPAPSATGNENAVKLPQAKAAAVSAGASLARKRNSGGSKP